MTALKPMTRQELADYYPFLQDTFPPDELKPLDMLHRQLDQGVCDAWLLTENGSPKGLALMLRTGGGPYVLLDYLAMLEKGSGWGSQCLELLKAQYPQGILVEAEAALPELPPETLALRQRRLRFYQRAGFVPCPFKNCIFGVVYLVHLWAKRWPENPARACAQAYYQLYRGQLPPQWMNAHIYIEGFCPSKEEHA